MTGLIVNQSIEEKAVIAFKVGWPGIRRCLFPSSAPNAIGEGEEHFPRASQRSARLAAWWLVSAIVVDVLLSLSLSFLVAYVGLHSSCPP